MGLALSFEKLNIFCLFATTLAYAFQPYPSALAGDPIPDPSLFALPGMSLRSVQTAHPRPPVEETSASLLNSAQMPTEISVSEKTLREIDSYFRTARDGSDHFKLNLGRIGEIFGFKNLQTGRTSRLDLGQKKETVRTGAWMINPASSSNRRLAENEKPFDYMAVGLFAQFNWGKNSLSSEDYESSELR